MSCNSCAKPYSLLRKEKGCPSCGFSYCSKCLANKAFVPKLNAEAKVCAKCVRSPATDENAKIIPPDAYYKRIAAMSSSIADSSSNSKDQEILKRLQNLKKATSTTSEKGSNDDIAKRLQAIKGEVPSVSDEELQMRLNKLRGQPTIAAQNKPVLPAPDTRTEQEQANDLLKQYMEQTEIDSTYKDGFNEVISGIESRMQKLKGTKEPQNTTQSQENIESEDEEETIKKIIEKVKAESLLEDNATPQANDELPFCEICNEDATMRCLGCKYLFCKRCFLDHKDDDDGCDRYELYKPPNSN